MVAADKAYGSGIQNRVRIPGQRTDTADGAISHGDAALATHDAVEAKKEGSGG